MNKYHLILNKILAEEKMQENKKRFDLLLVERTTYIYTDRFVRYYIHIYENNIEKTKLLLAGEESIRLDLNV